jgi:hypothetical protein
LIVLLALGAGLEAARNAQGLQDLQGFCHT